MKSQRLIQRTLSSCRSAPATLSSTGPRLGTAITCTSRRGGASWTQWQCTSPSSQSSSISSPRLSREIRPSWVVRERVQLTTLPFDAFPELALVFHASELRLLFGPVPHSSVELEFANRML